MPRSGLKTLELTGALALSERKAPPASRTFRQMLSVSLAAVRDLIA